ncbi:MAG: 16S rRNA (adenine(1518)-N(6)/adenine(1519)-N(6))-dimethyltransferase RsmA [Cyanobacteria bacterium J06635_15]
MAARPRKRFGQHWLTSQAVLAQIVSSAQLQDGDRVLEIGPGQGVLTERLLHQAETVIAVEVDRDLGKLLRQKFAAHPGFHLLETDFLTLDLLGALGHNAIAEPNKVVANIPYYITGPILEKLVGGINQPPLLPFEAIVLLVQREVADRLCAPPGSKTYGAMSVRMQYLAECEWICEVPPQAFYPPPKVTSAVVRLRPRRFIPAADDPRLLAQLVQAGFASRRKMLRNNIRDIVERDRLAALFTTLGLAPEVRAENLSVENWVVLSNRIQGEGSF